MGKYSRLGKNAVLVFVGNIGSKLITLLMLPFYTDWLSVADYGVTDIITIYAAFLVGIISFSIAEAIFVFPKGAKKEKQMEYFSSGLFFAIISFLVAAVLFFIAKIIFQTFNITNSFEEYSWLIYWVVVATFVQNYMQQFSRSIDKIRVYAISGIVLTAFTAILAFILIPKYGVFGFVLAQILALTIAATYTFLFSKAFSFLSIKAIKKENYKEMLRYSIPLIPNGIMWWLVSALNRPLLEHYTKIDDVGLFAVANKFPSVIIMVFTVFIFSWQISVIEEYKKAGYKEFYNKILRIVFLIITLLSCGMTIFSKFIISVIADHKFIEAWKVVPILSLAVLFYTLSAFVGTNFSATRESKYYFYSSVWGAIASIILNFIFIPIFGLFGAALSIVLSYAVMAISRIKYSWKFVHITNIHIYILMILINILVVVITFHIQSIVVKTIAFLLLFIAFMIINNSIIVDLRATYVILKTKFIKNKNN